MLLPRPPANTPVRAFRLRQFSGHTASAAACAAALLLPASFDRCGFIDEVSPLNQGLRVMKGGAFSEAVLKADLAFFREVCSACTLLESDRLGRLSASLHVYKRDRRNRDTAWVEVLSLGGTHACCCRVLKRVAVRMLCCCLQAAAWWSTRMLQAYCMQALLT
jgi:hypothetical protein